MTEDQVRLLVREVIARQKGRQAVAPAEARLDVRAHISHHRFPLVTGDVDGPCLIEPAVRCSHCGFCQSYGH
jgi:hypothetical protein